MSPWRPAVSCGPPSFLLRSQNRKCSFCSKWSYLGEIREGRGEHAAKTAAALSSFSKTQVLGTQIFISLVHQEGDGGREEWLGSGVWGLKTITRTKLRHCVQSTVLIIPGKLSLFSFPSSELEHTCMRLNPSLAHTSMFSTAGLYLQLNILSVFLSSFCRATH